MNLKTVLLILSFMGASILTAFLFHRWQMQSLEASVEGKKSFASHAPLQEQLMSFWRRGQQRVQRSVASADSSLTSFEGPERCDGSRNYLKTELDRMPPMFRELRIRLQADFPRACMTYLMRQQEPESEHIASSQFVSCALDAPAPQRKPCVSETYVNVMYNLYVDVTNCFGLPQKDRLPVFLVRSGLHANWRSDEAWGATGLGPVARERASHQLEAYKNRIRESEADSCKRLKPYLEGISVSLTSRDQVCAWMKMPQNPLLNLLAWAISYDQDISLVRESEAREKIGDLLREAGFSDFEPEQLEQLLVTLSAETGPSAAVLLLKNYLQERLELMRSGQSGPLTREDLAFQPGPLREGSFASYLQQHQRTGDARFLTKVLQGATSLNAVFKEGTCVSESFLSF